MAANGATYAGNMLACLGYHVPVIDPEGTGYPVVTPETIVEHGITDLFLSSEPHEFTTAEGRSWTQHFNDVPNRRLRFTSSTARI
ncbi:MAG: hypothetical protein CM15mP78_06370 [Candidatus Poseidoniales archaeon]|nr:MAG: hypothetical protein CM15mP78_06370 [Candidatus Poseidoniales archaeon]